VINQCFGDYWGGGKYQCMVTLRRNRVGNNS